MDGPDKDNKYGIRRDPASAWIGGRHASGLQFRMHVALHVAQRNVES